MPAKHKIRLKKTDNWASNSCPGPNFPKPSTIQYVCHCIQYFKREWGSKIAHRTHLNIKNCSQGNKKGVVANVRQCCSPLTPPIKRLKAAPIVSTRQGLLNRDISQTTAHPLSFSLNQTARETKYHLVYK